MQSHFEQQSSVSPLPKSSELVDTYRIEHKTSKHRKLAIFDTEFKRTERNPTKHFASKQHPSQMTNQSYALLMAGLMPISRYWISHKYHLRLKQFEIQREP